MHRLSEPPQAMSGPLEESREQAQVAGASPSTLLALRPIVVRRIRRDTPSTRAKVDRARIVWRREYHPRLHRAPQSPVFQRLCNLGPDVRVQDCTALRRHSHHYRQEEQK